MVQVHVKTVVEGSGLCQTNARRLNASAKLLCENQGDEGLAFALWSLAVEELGKAILLREPIGSRGADEIISMQPAFDHRSAFTRGFSELHDLHNTRFARVFRMTSNANASTIPVKDPIGSTDRSFPIPSGITGWFEATGHNEAGEPPSVDLRMDLLYVNWSSKERKWVHPSHSELPSRSSGRWELKRDDVRSAINSLDLRLAEQPGR
jgi:AbiV family abortive infection protein